MEYVNKYFFSLVIGTLLLLLIASGYFRFIVLNDYLVTYEVPCDSTMEACFIGCDDEACLDTYHYSMIERKAYAVRAQCGTSILDCSAANVCDVNEKSCHLTLCDPDIEVCVTDEFN